MHNLGGVVSVEQESATSITMLENGEAWQISPEW